MKKVISSSLIMITALAALLILLIACQTEPTTPPVSYSLPELKYRLISSYSDIFYCDPDYYPVAREGQEEQNAIDKFSEIRADSDEFSAILKHLSFSEKADYSRAEKLSIYREHKKLTYAVQTSPSGENYEFDLRVGEDQGQRFKGIITSSGKITVQKKDISFNTCPICLAEGTLIDTPSGPIAIENLYSETEIWTMDKANERCIGTIIKAASTPVPSGHVVIKITLSDGRSVTVSPSHPTTDGTPIGDFLPGNTLDGSEVISIQHLLYNKAFTYDILPSGGTGLYWANNILLKSTLVKNQ